MPTASAHGASWSFSLAGSYQRLRTSLRDRRIRSKARRWSRDDADRMAFYQQFIRPGAVVFDVGANQGNRTKVFLRLGATVVAVEPQPACADFIESLFGNNQALTVARTAIGAEPGEATMMTSRHSTIATLAGDWVESVSASGRFERSLWDGNLTVPVTTLDTLIQQHGTPSFVKVDVEGFELQVLRGLSSPVPAISLEFVPEELDKIIACIDQLETLGRWRYGISLGESMRFSTAPDRDRGQIIEDLKQVPSEEFGDLYAFHQDEAA